MILEPKVLYKITYDNNHSAGLDSFCVISEILNVDKLRYYLQDVRVIKDSSDRYILETWSINMCSLEHTDYTIEEIGPKKEYPEYYL